MFDDETPLTFHTSPGTLLSIASSQVALLCWRHQFVRLYLNEKVTLSPSWFTEDHFNSVDIFQLPKHIGALIDRHIRLTGKAIARWWMGHKDLFDISGYEMMSKCINYLIFDSNGNINYTSTATNLLANANVNGNLSLIEQYIIACSYCFENEIKRLWRSVRASHRLRTIDFDEHPSLGYWTCRMRNELRKVPGDRREPAEFRVFSSNHYWLWSEVEYYWDRLNERKRKMLIKIILSKDSIVKHFLTKLNIKQLRYALQNGCRADVILYNVAKHEFNGVLALQTWHYLKNLIHKNDFTAVLNGLFVLAFNELKYHFDHAAVLVYDVWSSAPDHLRSDFFTENREDFFDALCGTDKECDMRWYGRDLRFLLEIFANVDFDTKYRIWTKNWRKLILLATPSDLDKFLKLLWDNEEDIENFKKTKMMVRSGKTDQYFDKFIKYGSSRELIDYLKFCSTDEEKVRNVMKQIIEYNLYRLHRFKLTSLIKFVDFIDNAFPTPDLAQDYKEMIVFEKHEDWDELLNENPLKGVKNLVECFVTSDPKLVIEIKQKCLERCKQNLTSGKFKHFDGRDWQEFLLWCTSNEEEFTNFKKSISVDEVFYAMLTKVIRGSYAAFYKKSRAMRIFSSSVESPDVLLSLPSLRAFLRWYFESEGAVTQFKQQKINNYKKDETLRSIFKKESKENLGRVLDWFFDGNTVKVAQFCLVNFADLSCDDGDEDKKSNEGEESDEVDVSFDLYSSDSYEIQDSDEY